MIQEDYAMKNIRDSISLGLKIRKYWFYMHLSGKYCKTKILCGESQYFYSLEDYSRILLIFVVADTKQ